MGQRISYIGSRVPRAFPLPTMSLQLPNELNLSPHLSAHKYFLVCTLTVAAWDTLVLSPRFWRLWKSPGWPALKILFMFLRTFMPAEFIVVGELPLQRLYMAFY